MDDRRFDALTRSLSSRRSALGGLLGGVVTLVGVALPEESEAHTLGANCRRIKHLRRRRTCLRRARAHIRTCHPQSPATTCAAGCGVRINNCGQTVPCPCPPGKECLSNGSCALTCDFYNGPHCPTGCYCPHHPSTDGRLRCTASGNCTEQTPRCESTAQCPVGYHCQAVYCGGSFDLTNRCMPVCPS